jgi:hypothetical protein
MAAFYLYHVLALVNYLIIKYMKLKFIENLKVEKGNVLIGKNGQLRLKKNVVEQYSIKEGQRYMIGYDTEEKPTKNLYLYPEENMNGFKVTYQNSSYTICAKGVALTLGLKLPLKTQIEPWTYNNGSKNIKGFRLSF